MQPTSVFLDGSIPRLVPPAPRLTIAIPTYNRPQQLKRTLGIVLPQIMTDPRVCLLILDNHSDTPASQLLTEVLGQGPAVANPTRLRVMRHASNIGGNANIMRCFELCETAWIWVLGDDDAPAADAVQTILRETQSDACVIFHSVPAIQQPTIPSGDTLCGQSFEELLTCWGGNFFQMLFLSAAVFHMPALRPHLLTGYLCMNAGAPHLSMAMEALRAGGSWQLSRAVIADWLPPETGQHGNMLPLLFALPELFCLPANPAEVATFRRIAQRGLLNSPKRVLYTLIARYRATPCSAGIFYLYRCLKAVYCPFPWENPGLWWRWQLSVLNLAFPATFSRHYARRKKGRIILMTNAKRS